jgi:hypothetical protein
VATKRKVGGGLHVGVGLISFSILILALAISVAGIFVDSLGVRLLVVAAGVVLVVVLWMVAVRNGRAVREFRDRLKTENPGALVEQVRLWMLPKGRPEPGIPATFLIASPTEVSFQDIDQVVHLRIPVADLGFVGLVRAQQDATTRDKALTLIYGDDQFTVQFFTITSASLDKLEARVRTAIAWPAEGSPADTTL